MTCPSHTDLREELTALAETQPYSADPSAWDRGRRARRRSRIARGPRSSQSWPLVAGGGVLVARPDTVPPADEVRGGAIPIRIHLGGGDTTVDSPSDPSPFEDDYAIGRASVALGGNHLVLVGAEDRTYHDFAATGEAVALSPDGHRVAWWSGGGATPVGDLPDRRPAHR